MPDEDKYREVIRRATVVTTVLVLLCIAAMVVMLTVALGAALF